MSYTALYRKWRPDSFADVKGQDHIVTTLKNQIRYDRIGHAYLFCGTRGTGKTTVAKILARAVNCIKPVDGNPCGECELCRSIADGSSLNVIEIDAASNNGVDNIRQIRDEVVYRPTEGRYKVYIIDEVHMLSIGAFNALLKTLEEPPEYVIFILATTEAHKIPVTIMSRCQRYDFRRISVETITERLKELTAAENVRSEEKALRYIAKTADGAMRDALSLLDRCMAFYIDGELKYGNVLEVLGTVDTDVFSALLRHIVNGDAASIIRTVDEIILEGRDLNLFVSDFTWYLRNLLMLKASDEAENMIDMSEENMARLKEEAFMLEEGAVMRYIRILSELGASLRFATQKRVQVEVAMVKLAKPQMETDTESVTERLKRLEELVKEKEELIALTALRPEPPAQTGAATAETQTGAPKPPKHEIKALSDDLRMVVTNWRGIVGQMEDVYENFLKAVRLTVVDDKLCLVADNKFVYDYLSTEKCTGSLKRVIEDTIGKNVELEVTLLDAGGSFEDTFTNVEDYVKMDITVED
ncbi:MAG: DNA polymerase III subunit gamma/tau [Butyrivibrio sp.]|nr:DNA polymerase III subunit gamma/tau [Butyrivibrio sp.]